MGSCASLRSAIYNVRQAQLSGKGRSVAAYGLAKAVIEHPVLSAKIVYGALSRRLG